MKVLYDISKKRIFFFIKYGLIPAGLVFCLGYLCMYSFWLLLGTSQNLPGFFDYKAAIIGDGMCLPVLIGALNMFIHLYPPVSIKGKKLGYIIGILFGLIAVIVQGQWLVSDYTLLNWTIPILHHFNIAGWYHSLFFIAMFTIIGILFSNMWCIRFENKACHFEISGILCQTIIWASGAGFLFLFFIDDYCNPENYFLVLTLVLIGIFIFASCFNFSSIPKNVKSDTISVLSGIFSAYGFAIYIMGNHTINWLLVTASLFLSVIFVVGVYSKFFLFISYYLIIILPVFFLNIATNSFPYKEKSIVLLGITISIPCIIMLCHMNNSNKLIIRRNVLFASFILIGIMSVEIIQYQNYSNYLILFDAVSPIIIGTISAKFVKSSFNKVVSIEDQIKIIRTEEDRLLVSNSQREVYFSYILIALGCLILLIQNIIKKINIINLNIKSTMKLNLLNIAFCGLFLTILLLLGILRKRVGRKEIINVCTIIMLLFTYISLALLLQNNYSVIKIYDFSIIYIFTFITPIGLSMVIACGFYYNISKIRGIKSTWDIKLTSLLIFLGALINMIICQIEIIRNNSVNYIIVCIIKIVICMLFIPYLVSRILYDTLPEEQIALNTKSAGIIQDGILYSMLMVFGGIVPTLCLMSADDKLMGTITVIGILLYICWPLSYCIKNNVEHYVKRKTVVYNDKHFNSVFKEELNGLRQLIVIQNALSILAMFPYSIIILVLMFWDHSERLEKEKFINKIFPLK